MPDALTAAARTHAKPLMDSPADNRGVEFWAPAAGFEGLYEVSTLGRVKSLPRVVWRSDGRTHSVKGGILQPATRKCGGYQHVVLRKDGTHHTRTLHRLVLEAFIGPRPIGYECCHCNGNPQDNRLVNLRWDTPKSNGQDRKMHGTSNKGFSNPRSYLAPETIISIRATAGSDRVVADAYGVSPETVRRVRKGLRWADVKEA